jgi:hypothetical protein
MLSNALCLPLMNLTGLFLERAQLRDVRGVGSAIVLSYLLAPFQAVAALKGLIEKDEGPWYRTPKTGRVTELVSHLANVGHRRQQAGAHAVGLRTPASALSRGWRLPGRRGAIALLAMAIVLGGLAIASSRAEPAYAATAFYLHAGGSMDQAASTASTLQVADLSSIGAADTWATPTAYPAQTVAAGTYTFTYWATGGVGASATVAMTFGYSPLASCGTVTPIGSAAANVLTPGNGNTSDFTVTVPVALPADSYLCFTITVGVVAGGGLSLDYDTASQPSNLSTPTITVPVRGWPLLLVAALVIPIAVRRRLDIRTR